MVYSRKAAMARVTSVKTVVILLILLLSFFAILTVANYAFAKATGTGADFLIRWLPIRLLLFEGFENPYSPDVSLQIQNFMYGRPRVEGEMVGLFAYPYYIIGFIFPFALIQDFDLALAFWMTFLQISHLLIIYLSCRILNFQPKRFMLLLLLVLSLASSRFLQPIVEGNPSSLVGLFIACCLYFLWKRKDVLSGIFLAFSTIKPQMVIVFFILVWLWSFSVKRWKVIFSSGIGVVILMGISFLIYPAWFSEFLNQILFYPSVASPNTPATILSQWMPTGAPYVGAVLSILSGVLILWYWYKAYGKEFNHLFWASCITFALLPFTGMVFGNRNLVASLPAIVLILSIWLKQYGDKVKIIQAVLLIWIGVSWLVLLTPAININVPFFTFGNYLPLPFMLAIFLLITRRKFLTLNVEGHEKDAT